MEVDGRKEDGSTVENKQKYVGREGELGGCGP